MSEINYSELAGMAAEFAKIEPYAAKLSATEPAHLEVITVDLELLKEQSSLLDAYTNALDNPITISDENLILDPNF